LECGDTEERAHFIKFHKTLTWQNRKLLNSTQLHFNHYVENSVPYTENEKGHITAFTCHVM